MHIVLWISITVPFFLNGLLVETIALSIVCIDTTWNPALPRVSVLQLERFFR